MSSKKYPINEIFSSIQGEGPYVGQVMVFVRMAGCNLTCEWCDTEFGMKEQLTAGEIVQKVRDLSLPGVSVCFTGGEPCLTIDRALVDAVNRAGRPLHLETNGMYLVPFYRLFKSIVVSPKLPGREIMNWGWVRAYWAAVAGRITTLKIVFDTGLKFHLAEIMEDWGKFNWDRKYLQPLWANDRHNIADVISFVHGDPAWMISTQQHKDWGVQ
jgi:7-carboxy-7-deazaguanine synthase